MKRQSPRSLAVTDAFKSYVLDQLDALGDVTPRAMFGGVGLYCGGVFFGILARDKLFLKVDDSNRGDYSEHRMQPFKPYPDREGTMRYFEVPLSVLESPLDLIEWARKAVAVAAAVNGPKAGRQSGSRNPRAARDRRPRGPRDSSYRTRRR
jgi:DNA transformation protein and related proteins